MSGKIGLKKTAAAGKKNVWVNVLETTTGGFGLDITGLTKGDELVAGTAMLFDEETRLAKPDSTAPNGLLYEDVKIDDNTTVDVVIRGTVYENRIPAISAELKKGMKGILFSKSK